jgi:hypothetical protein
MSPAVYLAPVSHPSAARGTPKMNALNVDPEEVHGRLWLADRRPADVGHNAELIHHTKVPDGTCCWDDCIHEQAIHGKTEHAAGISRGRGCTVHSLLLPSGTSSMSLAMYLASVSHPSAKREFRDECAESASGN